MKDKIFNLIEKIEEEGLFDEAEEIIDSLMKENKIEVFEISIDDMFDSPGYDVYSVAVAWLQDGILQLAVGSVGLA